MIESNPKMNIEVFSNLTIQPLIIKSKCPICGEKIKISIQKEQLQNIKHYPFSHLHIHGKELHGIIYYIDAHFKIRCFEPVKNIQIESD